jgi:tRNA(Ile)-lysidine synthase
MWILKAENILNVRLFCAHINHQLREIEADADERFVVSQAAELNLPIVIKRVDVYGFARSSKLSIETAARKLRIEALLDAAKANDCDCIVTGHQKNDNAETILQRLSRGTGIRGLCGIWPMRIFNDNINFIRPLLGVTRDEIIQYLQKRNLTWQIDHTNADCAYRRNYIRHRMLPALQQQCEGLLIEQLFSLSKAARRFYGLICSRAEAAWSKLVNLAEGKAELNLPGFLLESKPVKVELIRRCLAALGSGEKDLSQRHFEWILQLSKQDSVGKKIELPGRFIIKREHEKLVFSKFDKETVCIKPISSSTELMIPGRTQFCQFSIEAIVFRKSEIRYLAPSSKGGSVTQFIELFDLDKIKPPLIVRHRQVGDKFWPLGLKAEKKVGKFLTATKLLQELRAKVLIVADSEEIIWVWPIRISEKVKITDQTREIIQLRISDTKLKCLK